MRRRRWFRLAWAAALAWSTGSAAAVARQPVPATPSVPTTSPPRPPARGAATVVPVRGTPGAAYVASGGDASTEAGGTTPGSSAGARPRPAVYWASLAYPGTNAGGTPCIATVRRPYPSAAAAGVAEDSFRAILPLALRGFPLCPGETLPLTTPDIEAAKYWQVAGIDLLPKPAPRIAPGYMLAGKLAYLEANSQPAVHFEHPTPLGLLTIDATSALFVDWGDLFDRTRLDGPHAGPGGPWPDGTITHFWTDARTYDIRVEQRWSATWHLAGDGGSLVGLTTEGQLPDFEVRQLQAVRNR
ncbi:MAG: hypothetical protein ACR2MO_01790 [Acidimicrobiales bacterium]